jgi:hypothetical protein
LLAGRFALHRPFATLVPETDSELANFLLRGAAENIVRDECAERRRPVEFTDLRQFLPGGTAEFAAFDLI